jgi:hypothetical protein
VEIDFHFVCEQVAKKLLEVQFISVNNQLADSFTKPVSADRLWAFKFNLNIVES